MTLEQLYVELDAVNIALDNAMARVEAAQLANKRGQILGEIKRLERERND